MNRSWIMAIVILLSLSACEKEEKQAVFYLKDIIIDKEVVAQNQSLNISAELGMFGDIHNNDISYEWDASEGRFNDRNAQATFWEAPDDYTGDVVLDLTVSYLKQTEEGEVKIKVVKSPAEDWGSISGYLYDEQMNVLKDVKVTTVTGETGTSDKNGFFYISDIPQGISGLTFSNIDYDWLADIPGEIRITGGNHTHLQKIIIFHNVTPSFSGYEKYPEEKAKLYYNISHPELYRYIELYESYYSSGKNSTLVAKLDPDKNAFMVALSSSYYSDKYYALKAVPFNGEPNSELSWYHVTFTESIDPDADYSFFTYKDFFHATLNWKLTGFEDYFRGFKIAKLNGSHWNFVSNILPVDQTSYELSTVPGQTGIYYVISITKNNNYNSSQSTLNRIELSVPELETPGGFTASYDADLNKVTLGWDRLTSRLDWYSGYVIERTDVTYPLEEDWTRIKEFSSMYYTSFTDSNITTVTNYKYRIRSVVYPPGGGTPYYSTANQRSVSTY